MLRRLTKSGVVSSLARNAGTLAKPSSDYVPNDTNTRNWLTRLGEISNTP